VLGLRILHTSAKRKETIGSTWLPTYRGAGVTAADRLYHAGVDAETREAWISSAITWSTHPMSTATLIESFDQR
jgi:hypothetical protein